MLEMCYRNKMSTSFYPRWIFFGVRDEMLLNISGPNANTNRIKVSNYTQCFSTNTTLGGGGWGGGGMIRLLTSRGASRDLPSLEKFH